MPSKNHNTPWTAAEIKRLRALAQSKCSSRLAAVKLGRTMGAVKYKAMTLGIRFRFLEQPRGVQRKLGRLRMKTGRMDVTLAA